MDVKKAIQKVAQKPAQSVFDAVMRDGVKLYKLPPQANRQLAAIAWRYLKLTAFGQQDREVIKDAMKLIIEELRKQRNWTLFDYELFFRMGATGKFGLKKPDVQVILGQWLSEYKRRQNEAFERRAAMRKVGRRGKPNPPPPEIAAQLNALVDCLKNKRRPRSLEEAIRAKGWDYDKYEARLWRLARKQAEVPAEEYFHYLCNRAKNRHLKT